MRRFVIERDLPGAGNFSPAQLRDIANTSCAVLRNMGPNIQWVCSYVSADRIFCVYLAEDERLLREHARRAGFPCTNISEVEHVIDPTAAAPECVA